MSEDTQAISHAPVGQFLVSPRGVAFHVFIMVPRPDGGDTYGPFTAQAFLDAVSALRLTAEAEQHTRDCIDCAFDLEVWREAPAGGEFDQQPLCAVGRQLADAAALKRRAALSALGVLP